MRRTWNRLGLLALVLGLSGIAQESVAVAVVLAVAGTLGIAVIGLVEEGRGNDAGDE